VLAPDGWASGKFVYSHLGRAADGILVFYQGLPLQRLPPAGRRFVREFGASQPGASVSAEAVYAAAATEVLLDAIARSDGSRASVTRALLATDLRSGLTGDVRFDRDGDVRPSPFYVFRLLDRSIVAGQVAPDASNLVAVL
jgi:branched-chain amino acid transport system substrate-binding protein